MCGRKRNAVTWPGEIYNPQADEKRDRSNDLKIEQRLQAHAPDFFQIPTAGYSHDQRREDQRRNDRFNQVEKNVAKKIDAIAPVGADVSQQAAREQTN